jgi:hypothetical protein
MHRARTEKKCAENNALHLGVRTCTFAMHSLRERAAAVKKEEARGALRERDALHTHRVIGGGIAVKGKGIHTCIQLLGGCEGGDHCLRPAANKR